MTVMERAPRTILWADRLFHHPAFDIGRAAAPGAGRKTAVPLSGTMSAFAGANRHHDLSIRDIVLSNPWREVTRNQVLAEEAAVFKTVAFSGPS